MSLRALFLLWQPCLHIGWTKTMLLKAYARRTVTFELPCVRATTNDNYTLLGPLLSCHASSLGLNVADVHQWCPLHGGHKQKRNVPRKIVLPNKSTKPSPLNKREPSLSHINNCSLACRPISLTVCVLSVRSSVICVAWFIYLYPRMAFGMINLLSANSGGNWSNFISV